MAKESLVSITLPAAVQGWNAASPVDELSPQEALKLENLYPDRDLEMRDGYEIYGTGLGTGSVESVAELALRTTGSRKLAAVANSKIYDCSSSGAAVEITGGTDPTSNRHQIHVANAAGTNALIFLDGASTPQQWTGGATKADTSFTGPTITTLVQGCVYRNRQYLCCVDSQSVWYSAPSVVSGALVEYDVGPFLTRGGSIQWVQGVCLGTASIQNAMLCIASEMGELLVYSGDYPENTWALTGRYYVGETLGRRSFVHVPGDLWIIAEDGVWSLSKLMQGGIRAETYNVQSAWAVATTAYGTNWGWSGCYYPAINAVIINVPLETNIRSEQWVANFSNLREDGFHPWCKFTGIPANQFCTFSRGLYFGTQSGYVMRADVGTDDNGANINIEWMSGYNYFNDRKLNKNFDAVRPVTTVIGDAALSVGVSVDFKENTKLLSTSISGGAITSWGSTWGSSWAGTSEVLNEWYGVEGIGYNGAINIKGAVKNTRLNFSAVQVRYLPGGEL